MMLDGAEECQLSGLIGELVPFRAVETAICAHNPWWWVVCSGSKCCAFSCCGGLPQPRHLVHRPPCHRRRRPRWSG
jgi:hypothetical protein